MFALKHAMCISDFSERLPWKHDRIMISNDVMETIKVHLSSSSDWGLSDVPPAFKLDKRENISARIDRKVHNTKKHKIKHEMKELLYKVTTQYVQISNIIDTSIKHPISGQSTPMEKGCVDICLI